MRFEEINNTLAKLLDKDDLLEAKKVFQDNHEIISVFSSREKYIILEKIMILEYKNGNIDCCKSMLIEMESLSEGLGGQYNYNTYLWKINLLINAGKYNSALWEANKLKKSLLDSETENTRILFDLENSIIRIYAALKKRKRILKLYRQLMALDMDRDSINKLQMNVGVFFYSVGNHELSKELFLCIIKRSTTGFYYGCANLYLARMSAGAERTILYLEAKSAFELLENRSLIALVDKELLY